MGTISGKILSTMLSASIVTTAVGYTGSQYLDTIKANIDTVTLKSTLLNDEAATKIEMANDLLEQKNKDITLLKEKLESLNKQLDEANDKLASLEEEKVDHDNVEVSSEADIAKSALHIEQKKTQTNEETEAIEETTEEPINTESNDQQQKTIEQTGEADNTADGSE